MEPKPWLKNYDKGVPATLQPYPACTLLDALSDSVRQRPNHPALLFKGGTINFEQLEKWSDAFAAALAAQGVEKGDRVALFMPNSPQMVIAMVGIWKTGAIAAPVNPLYTEHELEHAMKECGAETAVVLTPFYPKIKALQPRTEVKHIIASNIKEYLPTPLKILFTLFKEKKEGHRVAIAPEDSWFGELIGRYLTAPKPKVTVRPEDPALILFSGGTTGTPKAAVGHHHGMYMAGCQIQAWFKGTLIEWQDTLLAAMPLFHVYGNVGVLATGFVGHHPLALVPNPRDLPDMLATIRKVRPAFVPGVPTLFIALLNHPDVQAGKVDFKSVKLCISGAAPLLNETKTRFEALTGGRVVEGYALTETMMGAVVSPVNGTYKPGSTGMPLPDVEVRIVDAATGEQTLPPREVGEIAIYAPQLMREYWGRAKETAETIKKGWLFTGDLGYLDEDGYLFIVDRKKDVIKPSGFQVWPREVEEVIASHPAVAEVGVAGLPDEYQGESVVAWVVLREGQELTADSLRDFCRDKLAGYKVPKKIFFRNALPKTTVGKVLRRELVKEQTE